MHHRKPDELNAAQNALCESRECLEMAMEAGRLGIWEWRLDTGRITWSPTLERIHGLERGAFASTIEAYLRGIHPEDRDRVLDHSQQAIRERTEYRVEYRIIRPDGRIAWLEARGRLVAGPNGQPERMVGVCLDVTDRRQAEEALRDSESRLRAVVETAADGIITIDADGIIRTVNPAVERIFGYSADELIGHNVGILMPEPYRSEHDNYVKNFLRTGHAKIIGIGREVVGLRKDGKVIPLYLAVSETRIGDRRIFTGIVHDISDRKAAEEALARQAQELEQQARELARSNEELENFAGIVSHDLRSPLVTLAGCARLLEESPAALDPESRELIQTIRDSVEHLNELINSLLSYARAGSGELKVGPCDCEQVLQKVLVGLKVVLEANRAEVTHDPLPTICADAALMAQLFQNLIENGLKYHGQDPPRIHVSATAGAGEWVFSVRDNGIGIAPEDFPKVFEIFRRLHDDTSGYSGAGIGLATCKRIVERHGGRIWVESQPGQGATFFFAIPQQE